jgi:aryl-phospho-beta-D-glucosidase BglC (GH1 family)
MRRIGHHPSARLRLTLIAGFLSLVALGLGPARASAAFETTLPLNPEELDATKLNATLDLAKSAGVTQIQSSVTWWWLTRAGTPRSYDWSSLDRLVAAAESRGMRVVLQLQGTPDWVHPGLKSSVPNMFDRIWYAPTRSSTELNHWSNFVTDVVRRYRGRVGHYEIWNEENWSTFWKPGPDVDAYARLLRAAHYAAKSADPNARIVFGGLDRNDFGYLRSYYDSVKRQWPGEASSRRYFFDVLGVHPYSDERSPRVNDPAYVYGNSDRNFIGFRRLKRVMDNREGGNKQVYIGEYGFSTTNTWMRAVPDSTRAQHLRDAYALAAAEGYVSGLSWYYFVPDSANGPEWSIVDGGLRPSQTFSALRGAASGPVPSLIGTDGGGGSASLALKHQAQIGAAASPEASRCESGARRRARFGRAPWRAADPQKPPRSNSGSSRARSSRPARAASGSGSGAARLRGCCGTPGHARSACTSRPRTPPATPGERRRLRASPAERPPAGWKGAHRPAIGA